MEGESSAFHNATKIVNVVITYWVVSISMVFFNKSLVGSGNTDDVSIFIAWWQCVVCVVFILIYSRVGSLFSSDYQVHSIDFGVCWSGPVLGVAFLFSAMLSSNNYCLMYVGVAFFQIARSFTLIFTVIFSAVILQRGASLRICLCCLIVIAGFFLGVDQEKAAGTLSIIGVLFGLLSSIFVALNGIYTKKALSIDGMSPVKLTLHVNVNASLMLLIPALVSGQVYVVYTSGRLAEVWFWINTLMSGILGFLIAWASTRQIEFTSPVTHHISNNTKSIIQAFLATVIYHEVKTTLWWVGCCVVLLGAFLYTMTKMAEEKKSTTITVTQPKLRETV